MSLYIEINNNLQKAGIIEVGAAQVTQFAKVVAISPMGRFKDVRIFDEEKLKKGQRIIDDWNLFSLLIAVEELIQKGMEVNADTLIRIYHYDANISVTETSLNADGVEERQYVKLNNYIINNLMAIFSGEPEFQISTYTTFKP